MKKVAHLSMMLSFALLLSYVETLIPMPFSIPGMKLGLPNMAVMMLLSLFGWKEALLINLCRILLNGFLFGNLSAIYYSLSGALISFAVMVFLWKIPFFSLMGISIAGGCAHNIAQLLTAVLVVQTTQVLWYLPPLLVSGALTGAFNGLCATGAIPAVQQLMQTERS